MIIVIVAAVFIGVLCLIEGALLFLKDRFDIEMRNIRARLKFMSDESRGKDVVNLRRNRPLSAIPWLNKILIRIPLLQWLDIVLLQSGLKQPLGVFVLLSLIFVFAGLFFGFVLTEHLLLPVAFAAALAAAPTFYILLKKKKRVKKFEKQLPEALDLIARSLRAGHAFSTGLRMVAQEFGDPIGTEFQKTQAQINLGMSTEQALKAMTERIDCTDLQFFSVSVIIQRETGGNLAEILENISALIRNRFSLRGRIRALSAEGKLSAMILMGIPFGIALVLWAINPSYIKVLFEDPLGQKLLLCALSMMAVGIFVIKKMIDVKI
jgi:tight adherence protein B